MSPCLMEKNILYKKREIVFRSLICKGRTFCITSAVQVCGFWEEQFLSISKWEKDGSTAMRRKMLPHCQGSVPGSQVCPGAHSPLLSLLSRSLMGLLRGGNHLNAAVQCPTGKAVPKHGLSDADFYPARGESRLGSSLNSILIRKCNIPYEICLWEKILNRIIRRGRINMEKAPTDGQNHYNFSAVWWTEQCPSELAHTSLTWASLWWESGNWDINTASRAGKVLLQMQWQHLLHSIISMQEKVVLSLLLHMGSFLPLIPSKYIQFESAAGEVVAPGKPRAGICHGCVEPVHELLILELLTALIGNCNWDTPSWNQQLGPGEVVAPGKTRAGVCHANSPGSTSCVEPR